MQRALEAWIAARRCAATTQVGTVFPAGARYPLNASSATAVLPAYLAWLAFPGPAVQQLRASTQHKRRRAFPSAFSPENASQLHACDADDIGRADVPAGIQRRTAQCEPSVESSVVADGAHFMNSRVRSGLRPECPNDSRSIYSRKRRLPASASPTAAERSNSASFAFRRARAVIRLRSWCMGAAGGSRLGNSRRPRLRWTCCGRCP